MNKSSNHQSSVNHEPHIIQPLTIINHIKISHSNAASNAVSGAAARGARSRGSTSGRGGAGGAGGKLGATLSGSS